jgi:hypothetical protein
MTRLLLSLVMILAAFALCARPGHTQEKPPQEAPAETPKETPKEGTPREDGHDRPTPYPRIRFKPDKIEKVDTPEGGKKDVVSRVYLLDLSDDMTATESLEDGTVTSRLELAKSKMKQALDELSKRRDAVFNIASFGTVSDFADNSQPLAISAEVIEKAKKWVDDRVAGGKSDLYNLLKALFDQEPTSAQMLVGSSPAAPAGVDVKTIEAAGGVQDYLIAALTEWRGKKKTRLDIVGISLTEEQREFYRKLAQAGGGVYLDG